MLTSKELVEKIMKFEGCRLEAYQDAAGVWTIGYGHAHGVSQGDVITDYYAKEFLKKDISMAEKQVLALGVCKTQGQLDALTDFVFNLGIERLKQSTLLKVIKANFPSEEIIRQFHDRGLEVAVWTVNTPEAFERFKHMDVDYIESDVYGGYDL